MADGDGKETEFSTLACEGIWGPEFDISFAWFFCSLILRVVSFNSLLFRQFGVENANQSIMLDASNL